MMFATELTVQKRVWLEKMPELMWPKLHQLLVSLDDDSWLLHSSYSFPTTWNHFETRSWEHDGCFCLLSELHAPPFSVPVSPRSHGSKAAVPGGGVHWSPAGPRTGTVYRPHSEPSHCKWHMFTRKTLSHRNVHYLFYSKLVHKC